MKQIHVTQRENGLFDALWAGEAAFLGYSLLITRRK